jgi:xylulokinase
MTKQPMVAGGAGDNPAGAVGIVAIRSGTAFISLGTSILNTNAPKPELVLL